MPLLTTADAQQGRVRAVWTLDGRLLAPPIVVKSLSKHLTQTFTAKAVMHMRS